ncbi:SDR family oxidoreductase [candidate division KSB1 bacterium]|nr:SDR family oxidoreductase [candidate division KSB1 bacterium]RQW05095.1 MAG: SDR family oxidoreductase [candidate division KSB1 bacterium]
MAKFSFSENVILITGASAGIGRSLALQLAGHGAWLSLAARDQNRLEQLAQECRERGARALVVPTDVSEELQCKNFIEQTIAEYGRIDTLINNAGVSMFSRFDQIKDISYIRQIMNVNYMGSVCTTYYALPYLKASQGRLVGISSLTGKNGVPTRSAYAASKHAMAGFFDSIRIELADDGVSVTIIYPGFVATEVRQRAIQGDGSPLKESYIDETRVMSADACARIIITAAGKRKREVVMTTRAKIGLWLKLFSPGLVDKIAKKTVLSGK